jgi:hypothetical protein
MRRPVTCPRAADRPAGRVESQALRPVWEVDSRHRHSGALGGIQ